MGQIKQRNEFWRMSSRNRAGHADHPRVHITREAVLIHWSAGWTQEAISYALGIHVDTVNAHLRRARRKGDTRAVIRQAAARHALEAASA